MENKILDEVDKEKLKNGAEIKTYLEVSDNNVSESDKKIVEKNVENKLKSNTIAQILDIKLIKEITQSSTTTAIPVTYTNGEVEISLTIDDSLVNTDSSVNREYKVVRVHYEGDESEVDILDATYDASTKSITFKTNKFSTYAICYKDTKKEEKKEETTTTTDTTSSTKVVTCEEAMGSKNWTWSESKKACVYRVTNTSAK